MKRIKNIIIFIPLFVFLIISPLFPKDKKKEVKAMELRVESTAFSQGGMIPSIYTCDGKDVSPPLTWTGGPAGTKSYAIISDDPDAPGGTWVHWVIYNIPASITSLPENLPKTDEGQKEIIDARTRLGNLHCQMNHYMEGKVAVEPIIDLVERQKPYPGMDNSAL